MCPSTLDRTSESFGDEDRSSLPRLLSGFVVLHNHRPYCCGDLRSLNYQKAYFRSIECGLRIADLNIVFVYRNS